MILSSNSTAQSTMENKRIMKRYALISGLVLSALALTNCTTKEYDTPEDVIAKNGVPFEIIAQPSDETKTTAGADMSTLWDAENDKLNVFHKLHSATDYTSDGEFVVADETTGTFSGTISENVPVAGNNYDWVAIYPYSSYLSTVANDDNAASRAYYYIGCRSDKEQHQNGTGENATAHLAGYGYDGNYHHAFPLWGKKENVPYSASGEDYVSPVISMNQVCSVLAFNIKNETEAAIKVNKIEFTATEDIVGTFYIDFSGNMPIITATDDDHHSPTVTLEVTGGNIGIGETEVFYAGIKPFTVDGISEAKTLSMTVYTEGGESQTKEFTISGKTMTFAPNKYKNVYMDFKTEHVGDIIPEEPSTNDYILVENLADVTAGYYLIVNYDLVTANESFILKNGQLTSNTQTCEKLGDISNLSISADAKTITTSSDAVKWIFIANGTNEFKIKSGAANSNYFLLCKDDNKGLIISTWNWTSLQNTWTVSDGDTQYNCVQLSTTTGEFTRCLQTYLSEPDWRTYKSTSTSGYNYIRLYKKGTALPSSEIAFATPSFEFTLNDAAYSSFTGQVLTNPNNVSVTWSSSNTTLATVSNDGTVTLASNKTGETTISAIFAGNQTYRSETVSYTIKVNPNAAGLALPFTETFNDEAQTTTFNGGTGTLEFDNEGWDVTNGAPFNGSAKFGTGSAKGIAVTPEINASGNVTLTFDAAAWDGTGEQTTLDIVVSSGKIYSDSSLTDEISSVTLTVANWSRYTVYLKDVVSPFTVTFKGHVASKNRFFLDNIGMVSGIDTSMETVADPVFSPAGGTYTAAQSVTLSCATTGASIYYTTDGSTPSSGSTLYSEAIAVSETMTIKAIAIKGTKSSNVITASYTINIPTTDYVVLDWSFPGGTSSDLNNVVGVTTSGLGTDYAEGNAPYRIKFDSTGDYIMVKTDDSIGDVSIDYKMLGGGNTSYLNIFESSDGENWGSRIDRLEITGVQNDSGTLTTTATFNSTYRYVKIEFEKGSNVGIGGIRIRHTVPAKVATPSFSPVAGTYTSAQNVTISCATSGATIHYTTDGSTPTSSSTTYSGAIAISSTTTIKAIAVKSGMDNSAIATAVFTITGGGTQPANGDVLFSCDFGTAAVALASYTGGTSFGSASTITYTASDASKVKIDTNSAANMSGGNLYFNGKSNQAGYTATIAGIKPYGATKVTVKWAANNAYTDLVISQSSTAKVTSANSADNRAVFTLSGNENTISLVFSNNSKNNTRVDNVRVYFGEVN